MNLKKIRQVVDDAKKRYEENSSEYNKYLKNKSQFLSMDYLVPDYRKKQMAEFGYFPSLEEQRENFSQNNNGVSEVRSNNGSYRELNNAEGSKNLFNGSNPMGQGSGRGFTSGVSGGNGFNSNGGSGDGSFTRDAGASAGNAQFNVVGGGASNINIIAKNYIDPDTIEEAGSGKSSKVESLAKQLTKVSDNLLKSSSTDWEPINYRGVSEEYVLYKLSKVNIIYDEKEQKIMYNVVEPVLSEEEQGIIAELKKAFVYVFEKGSREGLKSSETSLIENGTKKLSAKYGIKMTPEQFEKIVYYLERDFLGLERIEPIMHDPYIEDVSCDGLGVPIFVNHLKYGPLEVNRKFSDFEKLNSFIVKLAQRSNQEVSLSKPILQGALPDGSRIEAIYGKEVSEKGSSFTIRKFRSEPFTPVHLMEFGTMTSFLLAYLWLAVENKQSLLVSGGTATGKTTILNALSLFVPPTSKIVSIEDTPEINLPHEHWLPLIARDNDGKAAVSMFDLLKASLRERPDYIIVGEIRGAEAAILFQGMATGHAGLGTVHAEKFEDLVNRMTIAPINLPKQLLTELNIIIFQKQFKIKNNMVRRTSSVVEIVSYSSRKDEFDTNEFIKFDPVKDVFVVQEKSSVISHLITLRGGKEEAVWNEIEKRRRILEFMKKNSILEFGEVSEIIKSYYKDPAGIFDVMKNYTRESIEDE